MIGEAEKRVGFDFPLEDFLSQTPDQSLLSGVTECKIVNDVTIDGGPQPGLRRIPRSCP